MSQHTLYLLWGVDVTTLKVFELTEPQEQTREHIHWDTPWSNILNTSVNRSETQGMNETQLPLAASPTQFLPHSSPKHSSHTQFPPTAPPDVSHTQLPTPLGHRLPLPHSSSHSCQLSQSPHACALCSGAATHLPPEVSITASVGRLLYTCMKVCLSMP